VNRNNEDCKLKTGSFMDDRSSVIPAVTYLKLYDKSVNAMHQLDYRESFSGYYDAGKYFGGFEISKFGITHKPQFEYILSEGTVGMLYYAGDQFRTMNRLENALEIYKKLISLNYDNKLLKGPLYKLGVAFAERDSKISGESGWKDGVRKYTGSDKKLKSFCKGYKKGWKK
jgi:tetratricopeptide (TPR) repeat protein